MTWGWSARGPAPVDLGGSRGSVAESKTTKAWPNYEAEYLRDRLQEADEQNVDEDNKYNPFPLKGEAKAVYLDKITDHYKDEADECLQSEFKQWLQGYGPEHEGMKPYVNKIGAPVRRYTFRNEMDDDAKPGDPMADGQWAPTWWQGKSLAHLPGVREYLRSDAEKAWWNDYQMNMLAEHGPQNLEQAWMYFKHWVKQRPITETNCFEHNMHQDTGPYATMGDRPAPGSMPHHIGPRPSFMPPPPGPPPPKVTPVASSIAGGTAGAAVAGPAGAAIGAATGEALVAEEYYDTDDEGDNYEDAVEILDPDPEEPTPPDEGLSPPDEGLSPPDAPEMPPRKEMPSHNARKMPKQSNYDKIVPPNKLIFK